MKFDIINIFKQIISKPLFARVLRSLDNMIKKCIIIKVHGLKQLYTEIKQKNIRPILKANENGIKTFEYTDSCVIINHSRLIKLLFNTVNTRINHNFKIRLANEQFWYIRLMWQNGFLNAQANKTIPNQISGNASPRDSFLKTIGFTEYFLISEFSLSK